MWIFYISVFNGNAQFAAGLCKKGSQTGLIFGIAIEAVVLCDILKSSEWLEHTKHRARWRI